MQDNIAIEPLVSVCLPAYNRIEKLKIAIKKLQEQTYTNLEIIVSDNCSTDNTENICKELQKEDHRIKYFRQSNNVGPTANFEFAKNKAEGKYFLWHGDDDYLDKEYVKVCIDELEKDSSYVLVSGLAAYRYFGKGDITHHGNIIQPNSDNPILRVVKYLWNVQENSIFCGAYRVNELNESYMPNVLAGDWIWMSKVLLKGKAKVIDNIYVNRSFGDSASVSYEKIIELIGSPKWHAKYPWLAMSKNFLSFYIQDKNILIGIISFIVIFVKGSWSNFKKYSKLGVVKKSLKKMFL
jgi:glycosyltransferase involved in cell wall biosynthesis